MRITILSAVMSVTFACLPPWLLADGVRENRSEIQFSLGALYMPMGGDFDDSRLFYHERDGLVREVVNVPDVDGGFGGSFGGGVRLPIGTANALGFGLAYALTGHDANSVLANSDALLHEFSIDAKWYFRANRQFQPFVAAGIGIPLLQVEDASLSPSSGRPIGEATFRGRSFMVGGGAQMFFHDRWSLDLAAGFKHMSFDDAEVEDGDFRELPDELEASGVTFGVGVSYHFGFGPSRAPAAPAASEPAPGQV